MYGTLLDLNNYCFVFILDYDWDVAIELEVRIGDLELNLFFALCLSHCLHLCKTVINEMFENNISISVNSVKGNCETLNGQPIM